MSPLKRLLATKNCILKTKILKIIVFSTKKLFGNVFFPGPPPLNHHNQHHSNHATRSSPNSRAVPASSTLNKAICRN